MKKFNPELAIEEMLNHRKNQGYSKTQLSKYYFRKSQGHKIIPLLSKTFNEFRITIISRTCISRFILRQEDREFKGRIMIIEVCNTTK